MGRSKRKEKAAGSGRPSTTAARDDDPLEGGPMPEFINVPVLCMYLEAILQAMERTEGHTYAGVLSHVPRRRRRLDRLLATVRASPGIGGSNTASTSGGGGGPGSNMIYLVPVPTLAQGRRKAAVHNEYQRVLDVYAATRMSPLPPSSSSSGMTETASGRPPARATAPSGRLLPVRETAPSTAALLAQEGRIHDLERQIRDRETETETRESAQIRKIKALQQKIAQVEVQAAIRQVHAKLLEIKIRQVELMVLVKQAQQVMELRGKEEGLLAKKRLLEEKIRTLQTTLDDQTAQHQSLLAQAAAVGGDGSDGSPGGGAAGATTPPLPEAGGTDSGALLAAAGAQLPPNLLEDLDAVLAGGSGEVSTASSTATATATATATVATAGADDDAGDEGGP